MADKKEVKKKVVKLNKAPAKPKAKKVEPKLVDHEVTQEDLDNNPDLVTEGVAVGDTIQIPEEVQDAPEADSVDVLKDNGKIYIRTYSVANHGEDFMKSAEEFRAKHPTVLIVPSTDIPAVVVQYREKEDFEKPIKEQNPDAPFVDKTREFSDKEAALAFNNEKKGTISVKKQKKG